MRISGTYLDRLYIKVLPFTGSLFLFGLLIVSDKLLVFLSFLGLSLFIWIQDMLYIHFKHKKLQSLHVDNGTIRIGTELIFPDNIEQINPLKIMQGRIAVEVLEFHLANGSCLRVLDKPVNIWTVTSNKPSKTVMSILDEFPELSNKIEKPQIM